MVLETITNSRLFNQNLTTIILTRSGAGHVDHDVSLQRGHVIPRGGSTNHTNVFWKWRDGPDGPHRLQAVVAPGLSAHGAHALGQRQILIKLSALAFELRLVFIQEIAHHTV